MSPLDFGKQGRTHYFCDHWEIKEINSKPSVCEREIYKIALTSHTSHLILIKFSLESSKTESVKSSDCYSWEDEYFCSHLN